MDEGTNYIHDDLTKEEIIDKIYALKKEVKSFKGIVIDPNIFADLRASLPRANEEMAAMCSAESENTENEECNITALIPSDTNGNGNLYELATYKDVEAFAEAIAPIIETRKDPRLMFAYLEFDSALAKLESSKKEARDDLLTALDYMCLFAPSEEDFRSGKPTKLISFLEWLTELVKKGFKLLQVKSQQVWEILEDPDRYYLLLRGRIHELSRNDPDQAWLQVLMFIPDLFRLYARLLFDSSVSSETKLFLIGVIAYLILPYDLIPEGVVGPIGYGEDAFLLAKGILDLTNDAIIPYERLEQHWSGTPNQLRYLVSFSRGFSENFDYFRDLSVWLKTFRV